MSNIKQRMRARRATRQFNRAYVNASPSMQSELLAMAAHQNWNR